MAQPGNFTPILLYGSSTPTNVPLAANLINNATGSEIAINVADKNLFFKDSGGTVNTVPIRQSSTSSDGWLSATDWNTFNGKAPATSGTSILYGNGTGGFSNVTIGSGISFAGGTLSATGTGGTVTSVAASVPAFLSISGSPITTSGTLAISYSGTALPVANGGTATTTAFTAGSIVFAGASGVYSQNNANFFWDNTNARLGISTTSPAQKLDIRGSNTAIRIGSDTNDIGTLQFFNTTGSTINASIAANLEGGNAGGNLAFYTKYISGSLTEKMRIDGSGNVAVGTTTTSAAKLTVVGGNASNLLVDNDGSQYTQLLIQRNSTANTGADILIDGTNKIAYLRTLLDAPWVFSTSASAGSPSEKMRLTTAGLLGIGTSSPAALLDTQQSTTDMIGVSILNTNNSVGTATSAQLRLGITNSVGASYAVIKAQEGGADDYPALTFAVQNAATTTPTERMRIFSSGGVSIGNTTDPGAGNLSVTGTISSGAWPIITSNATYLMQASGVAFTGSTGTSTATLGVANAPVSGDPTKWITINDNGTLRRIPTW